MLFVISRYVMAVLYVAAGINHFRNPAFYRPMMPPYLPAPELLNYLAGATELSLGILVCVPLTSRFAAWGLIALLIAVFPANLYMYQTGGAGFNLPAWALLVRLPLQFLLIGWAYLYT